MASLDFNYIVDALPKYVKRLADIIGTQLAFGAPTLKRVTVRTGIKTSAAINFLGVNVPIQNGKGCGFNPDGDAELTERVINTAILKKEIEICPDTLLETWGEYEVNIPADRREKLPFEAYVVAEIIAETEEQLEDLIWNGKTAAQGGTDLLDGFLTIADSASGTIKVDINKGTSNYAAIKTVIASIPSKMKKLGYQVFVSPEFYEALCFELVDANLVHFDATKLADSFVFPGSRVEIVSTSGLAGTEKILASYKKNMFYGTDVEDAHRRVKITYSDRDDTFAVRFRWNSGVQFAFPARVVLATLNVEPEPEPESK